MAKRGAVQAVEPAVSLIEISRVLEDTARLVREHAGVQRETQSIERPPLGSVEARAIVAARWLRREYLGTDANDATWSMMLELFAARLEGRRVYQTMLGVAAAVPQSTALRITRKLLAQGTFVSKADSRDDRLLILDLSDEAADRIQAYLNATRAIIQAA